VLCLKRLSSHFTACCVLHCVFRVLLLFFHILPDVIIHDESKYENMCEKSFCTICTCSFLLYVFHVYMHKKTAYVHENMPLNLHVHMVFLMMKTWCLKCIEDTKNWIKQIKRKVCILLVMLHKYKFDLCTLIPLGKVFSCGVVSLSTLFFQNQLQQEVHL
jgi:uncharacterized protein with PQ loop repeat